MGCTCSTNKGKKIKFKGDDMDQKENDNSKTIENHLHDITNNNLSRHTDSMFTDIAFDINDKKKPLENHNANYQKDHNVMTNESFVGGSSSSKYCIQHHRFKKYKVNESITTMPNGMGMGNDPTKNEKAEGKSLNCNNNINTITESNPNDACLCTITNSNHLPLPPLQQHDSTKPSKEKHPTAQLTHVDPTDHNHSSSYATYSNANTQCNEQYQSHAYNPNNGNRGANECGNEATSCYEVNFDDMLDEAIAIEDMYYEMDDTQYRRYEEFLENTKSLEDLQGQQATAGGASHHLPNTSTTHQVFPTSSSSSSSSIPKPGSLTSGLLPPHSTHNRLPSSTLASTSSSLAPSSHHLHSHPHQHHSDGSGTSPGIPNGSTSGASGGNNSKTTALMEWSKLLHKNFSNYEKSSININDSKNKLYKVYKVLLKLKERYWYEEVAQLYKERYIGSKGHNNITTLTFDRKIIQLHEQFRWLVNAVANVKLNCNQQIGVAEFPPLKIQSKARRETFAGNTFPSNLTKGLNIQCGSDNANNNGFDILSSSPNKSQHTPKYSKYNSSSQPINEEKDGLVFLKDLPQDMISSSWQKGFVWKGVYFKLYSKKESESIKHEMKVLKHLAIESLQTETTIKLTENMGNIVVNGVGGNTSDAYRHQDNNNSFNPRSKSNPHLNNSSILNIILPLITYVESSSWVLLGSAIMPIKRPNENNGIVDEFMSKVCADNHNMFRNTLILSNSTPNNFKLYSKPPDEIVYHNSYTFGTLQTNHNYGSFAQNSTFNNNDSAGVSLMGSTSLNPHNHQQQQHHLVMLCNTSKLLLSLPKVMTMFLIRQNINTDIIFMDFPTRGQIDFTTLKQILGYSKLDIGANSLRKRKGATTIFKANNLLEQAQNDTDKPYQFELVKFKRMGWNLVMIHVVTKDLNFQVNQRALELLSNSKSKRSKDIRGNVLVFATCLNQHTIIHPYFLSELILASSLMDSSYYGMTSQTLEQQQQADPIANLDSHKQNAKFDLKSSLVIGPCSAKQIEMNNNSMITQQTATFQNISQTLGGNNGTLTSHNLSGLGTLPGMGGVLPGMGTLSGIGVKLNTENDSFRKEITFSINGNSSSKVLKHHYHNLKDENRLKEVLIPCIGKSIEYVVNQLWEQDTVLNYSMLGDLLHKRGLNMRFEWLIYVKLCQKSGVSSPNTNANNRTRALLGLDILIRTLKKTMSHLTSQKLHTYKKMWMGFYRHHHRAYSQCSMSSNSGGGSGPSGNGTNGGSISGRNEHNTELGIGRVNSCLRLEKYEDINSEKMEFFMENYFKKVLVGFINHLLKNYSNEVTSDDENAFYSKISTNLFLNRMRILDYAKRLMTKGEFEQLISINLIQEILNYPFLYANLLFDGLQHHFSLSISYEFIRQIRNDKYAFLISPLTSPIKPADLTVIFQNKPYITIRERSYLMLLKLMPLRNHSSMSSMKSIELNLPPSLYRMKKTRVQTQQEIHGGCESYLKDHYELPNLEIMNDWIVLLDSIFNSLYSPDGEQNFLIEAYIIQMVLSYFNESDDQANLGILEKIYTYFNGTPVCSPELTITIHTWCGILSESKSFSECEQSYMMALLTLHKHYGDPRSRGGLGIPWELFITWRLSILCRLQGKIHDAEYVEELFDAASSTLKSNSYCRSYNGFIINEPTTPKSSQNGLKTSKTLDFNLQSDEMINKFIGDFTNLAASQLINQGNKDALSQSRLSSKEQLHPFSHWINHLNFDENSCKMEVINSTLQKTHTVLKWIFLHMPIFHNSEKIWETAYLRDFYLALMQNSFANTTSVSSLSNYSVDRQQLKEKNQQIDGSSGGSGIGTGTGSISTPKNMTIRYDKKHKKLNHEGNLVHIFEKDSSTTCKREMNGIVYTWGQNTDGQIGLPLVPKADDDQVNNRKLKINFPRMVTALKDSIITSIASGRVHSAAITITKNVLVWGCNKSSQLGLGPDAPEQVFIPTEIPNLNDIKMISCGTEHTVALSSNYQVYSWGQGEGGLLGHGDTKSYSSPKLIEALKTQHITSIVCGGLHTIAIDKDGICYSWGRGEGGQLGLSLGELTHYSSNGNGGVSGGASGANDGGTGGGASVSGGVYVTTPKRIKGALENVFVIQIACGDAHSLALTQAGMVYAWGYSNLGQLGLGIADDLNNPNMSLQVTEPKLIERLSNVRICEIFAGSTFSLFVNDRKEIYGCGLNDYCQLGLEKNIGRVHTGLDNYRMPTASSKAIETAYPKKLDCFATIPILRVSCGENHSLALGLHDKYYMLFAWGMQKQGQLGLGDINMNYTLPRPISYLQDNMIYNMACGAYHSMIILGDASKTFKKDIVTDRLNKRSQNQWKLTFNEHNKESLEQSNNNETNRMLL